MGIRRSLIEFLFPHGITKHSYSLTQAFRDGDAPDIPYKAIQAVTKSIDSFITQSDKNEKNLIYLYFPIIAIESPLFEVELLFTNEIEIKEVNQSAYLIRNSNNNISSILSVVTKSSISNFAENAAEKIAVFIPYYKDKILDLIISNK